MAKNPAFSFYASDFLTDVMEWTPEEVGVYILLLSKQWVDGHLPNNVDRLARIAKCDKVRFLEIWSFVKEKFALYEDGFFRNKRLEKERAKKANFIARQQKNGSKGGRPKNPSLNPEKPKPFKNETQKKPKPNPLEKENENEIEIEKEIEKEVEKEKEIILPFSSKFFQEQWKVWKDYKRKEHGFRFKSTQSEQAQLSELRNKSSGNEAVAVKILHQSMANGWKGIFELRENGKQKHKGFDPNSFDLATLNELVDRD